MKLILVRHGQSQWNLENRFTGWRNPDLTDKGIHEAQEAGQHLKAENIHVDVAFTSALKRAQHTLDIILKEIGQTHIPTTQNEALNERDYGDLSGQNKAELAEKVGKEQVQIWRRSYDVAPPNGESLKDTRERVLPYYQDHIAPKLKEGKNVLVAAHGNSLRALVMFLEDLSPEEIVKKEIATGDPIIYDLDENLKVLGSNK